MWFAKIAAFMGGTFFKGALRWFIVPVVLIGFGYFGITKLVNKVSTVLDQSNKYEAIQIKLNDANQALADKDKEYATELARLENDRIKDQEHHVEFERAAIRENSKLKEALKANEENQIWHDGDIPDDIRRLLHEHTKATSKVPSELENTTSTK